MLQNNVSHQPEQKHKPYLHTHTRRAMETKEGAKDPLRLVLVGLQGVGKSAAGNTILGRAEFQSDISANCLTLQSKHAEGQVCGRQVTIVDTPGLFNSMLSDVQMKQELEKALSLCAPGPHTFLLVIQLGRFTEQERGVMEKLNKLLCSSVNPYTLVLFTYADKLKSKTLDQFINEDKLLLKLIDSCAGHYHAFDNTDNKNQAQVNELLDKIDNVIKKRGGKIFSVGTLKYLQIARVKIFGVPVSVVLILGAVSLLFIWKYVHVAVKAVDQHEKVVDVVLDQPEKVVDVVLDQPEKVVDVVLHQPEKVVDVVLHQPEKVVDVVLHQPGKVVEEVFCKTAQVSETPASLWESLLGLMDNKRILIPSAMSLVAGMWILKKILKK